MSGQKVHGMDDRESAFPSSLAGLSQMASQQSTVADKTENLSDTSSGADTVCILDSNVDAVNAATDGTLSLETSTKQSACFNVDSTSEKHLDGQSASGNQADTVSEASGAAAAAATSAESLVGLDFRAVMTQHRDMMDRMESEQQEMLCRVELAKAEIERAVQQAYGAVDNRVNELLADVAQLQSEREAQVEEAQSWMQSRLASMKYYRSFAQHLLKYGSPADITHYAPLLFANIQRVLNEQRPEVAPMSAESEAKLARLQAFVNLDVDELRQRMGGNLVGRISQTEEVDGCLCGGISAYMNQPVLIASTSVGNGVCGAAFLEGSLYIVRDRSSIVEVYVTSEGFVLSRAINVEQMTSPTSVVACSSANCLFVSDSQVCGLFHVPSSADVDVTLIPLDGIPHSLSVTTNDSLAVMFADTQAIQLVSATDSSVMQQIQIESVDRPISAIPVNGENNGFVICSETDNGSSWFIFGHRLEGPARSLEEPVHLRSLSGVSGLVSDPFGSYIGFSCMEHSVKLFDSTFELLRPLLSRSDGIQHPTALALNSVSGSLVIGQQNGVMHLYQVLCTRVKVEVAINNWV